ncbi:MAG: winged helix DNA-binding domain-containing protein [Acidiferrobacterales bacterium]|nr:winged helix DNA-binding domain-containing protein [Acidiferrobacterales bacterium]
MPVSLSPAEARKLVLNAQRILQVNKKGRAIDATMDACCHLGYIQIDTISVVARAHHHTLWTRNPRYRTTHLDQLLADRKIFEYWSHAAAYLPMDDYRFALPRMQLERQGKGHWHKKNASLMNQVLKRITEEGPLSARDFEDPGGGKRAVWEWKPAKYALEQLFMEGVIMTSSRQGFQKVYDLAERVLPAEVDKSVPSVNDYARHVIKRYLRANGLGKVVEFSHLRKGFKADIATAAAEMLESGELCEIQSCGEQWLAMDNALDHLNQPLSRARVRIISPFDNFIILRKRIRSLFQFNYQIECYLPAEKRLFGYFSLPIIWQGNLVARLDAKAHRKDGILEVKHLAIEGSLKKSAEFLTALAPELWRFAHFNECDDITVDRVSVSQGHDKAIRQLFKENIKKSVPANVCR